MGRRFVLLLSLVAWVVLMSWHGSSLPEITVKGIPGAGLAIQFVHSQQDLDEVIDEGAAQRTAIRTTLVRQQYQDVFFISQQDMDEVITQFQAPERTAIQTTLVNQQYLDVVFIGLYWAFFFFSMAAPLCRSGTRKWRVLGRVVRTFITLAALADLTEDFGIVSLLAPERLPHLWPFWFANAKWTLIFATLGLLTPSLILYDRVVRIDKVRPGWVLRLAQISAIFFGAAAVWGTAGVVGRFFGWGEMLTQGAALMGIGFLPLIGVFWWDLLGRPVPPGPDAANFKTVLTEELKEIQRAEAVRKKFCGEAMPSFPAQRRSALDEVKTAIAEPGSPIQQAGRRNLWGLAFSGGGIRSATFNLGVLQGLAERKLLRRFHYLSTISGGGYIGSWLMAWISRQGTEVVEGRLAAPRTQQPNFKEPPEVRFLREYSNYLTPRTGLLGMDTWTAIATVLRNLLLNQSVLSLFIAAALLAPRVVVAGARSCSWFLASASPMAALLVGLLVLVVIGIARNMARYGKSASQRVVARVSIEGPKTKRDEEPKEVRSNAGNGPMHRLKVEWLSSGAGPQDAVRLRNRIGSVEIWDKNLVLRRDVGHVTRLSAWSEDTLDLDMAAPNVENGDLVMEVDSWWAQPAGVYRLVVLPVFLGISFLTWLLAQDTLAGKPDWQWLAGGAVVAATAWLLGEVLSGTGFIRPKDVIRCTTLSFIRRALFRALAAACAGVVGASLLRLTAALLHRWQSLPGESWGTWLVIGMGTPIVALVFVAYSWVQLGLLSTLVQDPAREWAGRLEAWLLILSAGWAAIFALAGFAPLFVLWLTRFPSATWTSALGWAGASLAGILGGNSAKTGGMNPTVKDKLLSVTPYVFAVGLLVLVSVGVNQIISAPPADGAGAKTPDQISVQMDQVSDKQVKVQMQAVINKKRPPVPVAPYWKAFMGTSGRRVLAAFLFCLVGSLVLAMRVDLNEFSMHYLYRNRLVRCYLGASNRERVPNPFTGFDSGDDLHLAGLVADQGYDGPYPIMGCTLNLVHGEDLAWQERKGTSFIMTPKYCGYDVWYEKLLRPGQREKRGQASDGYRLTKDYAYPDGGVYIGTAMAISGAAVSPNMGYHSSPALAFLMTVFNVRLGQWMGNPRDQKCWRKPAPRIGLGYLLTELFGLTGDHSRYVYLSDGGHFENLGIYELVKRRCRLILAVDAAEDKDLSFDDLASAVRKCRSDMGIDIEIKTDKLHKVGKTGFSPWHCAIGLIKYCNSDPPIDNLPAGSDKTVKDGILVYVKPSLTNDEPADVLNYKRMHPVFPHEPTVDEWFSESQFESYRALGQHVIRTLFCGGGLSKDLSTIDIDDLIRCLQRDWNDPETINL
jgi:hypothetical protein